MYLNLKNTLGLLLLVAIVLVTWWLARAPRPTDPSIAQRPPVPPGYYLKEARMIGMDQDGQLLYRIAAEGAQQDTLSETMRLAGVRIEYQAEAETPWSLVSESGLAPVDQSYIELSGNVRLKTEGRAEDESFLITTERLTLSPSTNTASTDARVQIRMGNQQLNAMGMVAHLNEDRLELKSNVNGLFRP